MNVKTGLRTKDSARCPTSQLRSVTPICLNSNNQRLTPIAPAPIRRPPRRPRSVFISGNPALFTYIHYHKAIRECPICSARKKCDEERHDIRHGSGMYFKTYDTSMRAQWQDSPVTKMRVKCYQHPTLLARTFKDFFVIGARHIEIGSPHYIVAALAQRIRHFHAQHLVEIQPHVRLLRRSQTRCAQSNAWQRAGRR